MEQTLFRDNRITKNLGCKVEKLLENRSKSWRNESVDGQAEFLTEAIIGACTEIFPEIKRTRRKLHPWWNAELKASKLCLNRARRIWRRTRDNVDRLEFNRARNRHVGNLRRAKKDMWIRVTSEPMSDRNKWGNITRWIVKGKKIAELPSTMRKVEGHIRQIYPTR